MRIARVIGSVVSTIKADTLTGAKLLVVTPLGEGHAVEPYVAVDTVGAGRGEVVLVACGSAARLAERQSSQAPVDSTIVAIVDRLETEAWVNYVKD
ncbi:MULTISPECIES: EutN/CcmL family microcompartment protein [unclassified Micromonospora]|uniref:EutN/CcmL family microcompartment protein n=1 Tax=unclassified Micromonospora TaxID=2617518 RepID=UPI0010335E24|nr:MULTISPECIES: EutN/CcmL family microcompartment protein [unclassified Micromonospora]QKW13518.1 EutN/CcmL family microcompartment protein [Verrucosispora sp. NA02020]TBL39294.1 ethanolamine utilization protein EutN [Verrucosispora sp. SN26_14.1]